MHLEASLNIQQLQSLMYLQEILKTQSDTATIYHKNYWILANNDMKGLFSVLPYLLCISEVSHYVHPGPQIEFHKQPKDACRIEV